MEVRDSVPRRAGGTFLAVLNKKMYVVSQSEMDLDFGVACIYWIDVSC